MLNESQNYVVASSLVRTGDHNNFCSILHVKFTQNSSPGLLHVGLYLHDTVWRQRISLKTSFWQLKRLVTLSTYRRYTNNCIYLSISDRSCMIASGHMHHPSHIPGHMLSPKNYLGFTVQTDEDLDYLCP